MKERKLSNYQAVSIIVTVMISHIILNLPNHLISSTGSSTILNLVYVFAIAFIIFSVVYKILRLFPNSDIIDICEYTAGKRVKVLFGGLTCIYLLSISAFVIRVFAESLVLIYFPNIDLEIVVLIFIAAITLMNLLGFKAISRMSIIILPIILVTMVIIFISSCSDFVPQRALPILGYGASETFVSGIRKFVCF